MRIVVFRRPDAPTKPSRREKGTMMAHSSLADIFIINPVKCRRKKHGSGREVRSDCDDDFCMCLKSVVGHRLPVEDVSD